MVCIGIAAGLMGVEWDLLRNPVGLRVIIILLLFFWLRRRRRRRRRSEK